MSMTNPVDEFAAMTAALDVDAPFTEDEVTTALEIRAGHITDVETLIAGAEMAAQVLRWRPTSLGGADWVGRKLRGHLAHVAEVKGMVATQVAHLKAYEEKATRADLLAVAWCQDHLITYAHADRAESGGRRKSLKLPSVVIAGRTVPETVEIPKDRAEVFIAWAEENCPEAVKVEKSPLVSKLPAVTIDGDTVLVEGAGEVIPGAIRKTPEVGLKVRALEHVARPVDGDGTPVEDAEDVVTVEFVSYTVKPVPVEVPGVEYPPLAAVADEPSGD